MNRSATLLALAAVAAALQSCASPGPVASPSAASSTSREASSAPAPSGGGGRFTDAQAGRGRETFRSTCADCHYSSEFRGTQFQFAWGRRSVADLYREIVRNMPEDAPGSLSTQEYVDVVTYILRLNGFPAGEVELTADEDAMGAFTLEAPPPGPVPTPGRPSPDR